MALSAFGLDAPAVRLSGGQGRAWRAGAAVLKPSDTDPALVAWQSRVLSTVDGHPDFRVSPPMVARDGSWVVAGWTAWRFEPGRPAGSRWEEIIAAGRHFHQALVGVAAVPALGERSDIWAVADRMAWGDSDAPGPADDDATGPDLDRVVAALTPASGVAQLVHGDLTGNVLLDDRLPPLIIDFSPYWRPAGFASAVVVADALVFHDAPATVVDLLDADPDGQQYLLRALLFRAITARLARAEPARAERARAERPTRGDRLDRGTRNRHGRPEPDDAARFERAIDLALHHWPRPAPG